MSGSKKLRTLADTLAFYGIGQAARTVLRDVGYSLHKNLLKRRCIKRRVHDYRMYLSLHTKGISRELYLYGHREDDNTEILRRELKEGDRVLDIGANIGYFALMEATIVGPRGKVLAVEPDPRNLELLKMNIELNSMTSRIELHERVALSNTTGTSFLAIHRKSNLNALVGRRDVSSGDYIDVIPVQTIDIHDFLAKTGRISLVRMDLEGHEIEILGGLIRLAGSMPSLAPERILFEAHPHLYDGSGRNMRALLGDMTALGYAVRSITTSNEKENNAARKLGYQPWKTVRSDFKVRGIYNDLRTEDALELICGAGAVRTVLLSRPAMSPGES